MPVLLLQAQTIAASTPVLWAHGHAISPDNARQYVEPHLPNNMQTTIQEDAFFTVPPTSIPMQMTSPSHVFRDALTPMQLLHGL